MEGERGVVERTGGRQGRESGKGGIEAVKNERVQRWDEAKRRGAGKRRSAGQGTTVSSRDSATCLGGELGTVAQLDPGIQRLPP
jgi:hypothetical protein